MFTEIKGSNATAMTEALSRIGFRRSQNVVYRPSCDGCSACVSVRVAAAEFVPSTSQKRLLKRNADLDVSACEPWSTEEQFDLMRRYLARAPPRRRHGGDGRLRLRRHGRADAGRHRRHRISRARDADGRPARLVGACLTDKQSDGLSMVYSFFDPDRARPGLGTFIILDHIVRAAARGPAVRLSRLLDRGARRRWTTRRASRRSSGSARGAGCGTELPRQACATGDTTPAIIGSGAIAAAGAQRP